MFPIVGTAIASTFVYLKLAQAFRQLKYLHNFLFQTQARARERERGKAKPRNRTRLTREKHP